ncbi:TPA: hypothetical protein ACVU5H_004927 [Vibrio parahaemolyticus]|nr:hypothetical protein [Vibrio sp. 1403]
MLEIVVLNYFGAVLRYDALPRQQAVGQNLFRAFSKLVSDKL